MTDTLADAPGQAPLEGDTPLLQIRGLHVSFAPRRSLLGRGDDAIARAVDGVDLSLAEGEILALAGESGCGKTTLARSIMGFVEPNAGRSSSRVPRSARTSARTAARSRWSTRTPRVR